MIECRQDLGFAFEASHSRGILREDFGQNLDGYLALQPGVSRAVHFAHSSGVNRRKDLVGAKLVARSQGHRI